jgi:hypothetical protein
MCKGLGSITIITKKLILDFHKINIYGLLRANIWERRGENGRK